MEATNRFINIKNCLHYIVHQPTHHHLSGNFSTFNGSNNLLSRNILTWIKYFRELLPTWMEHVVYKCLCKLLLVCKFVVKFSQFIILDVTYCNDSATTISMMVFLCIIVNSFLTHLNIQELTTVEKLLFKLASTTNTTESNKIR